MYIYIYIYMGVEHSGKGNGIMQSSSNELSTLVADKA